jgi:hypothetical protein
LSLGLNGYFLIFVSRVRLLDGKLDAKAEEAAKAQVGMVRLQFEMEIKHARELIAQAQDAMVRGNGRFAHIEQAQGELKNELVKAIGEMEIKLLRSIGEYQDKLVTRAELDRRMEEMNRNA